MNRWYSVYFTGPLAFDVRRDADGRLAFTIWLALFGVPVLPWSAWTAAAARPRPMIGPDLDPGFEYFDLQPARPELGRLLLTLVEGWAWLATAVAPIVWLIVRTDGRAATPLELVAVLGLTLYAAALPMVGDWHRRRAVRG